MIDEKFVFLAVAVDLVGGISYLKDTLKGKVKPNKVSWFLWGLAPMIAFVSQLNQGVGLISWMTFAIGFSPIVIFFASFLNRKAEWKLTSFDIICGVLSILGLILWLVTKVGNLAIFFSILADLLAGIPTTVKAFKAPETENGLAFSLAGIGSIITLLTIRQWDFAHSAFAFYTLLYNFITYPLIEFKLGKRIKFNA